MIRFDDHILVDSTLITCEEYQLFLDVMRAQGKYLQPDHWKGYQFPSGQAYKPILGVRRSDALAFCEWLTVREGGEWQYRLPTVEEAKACPLATEITDPLGYWASSADDQTSEFVWAGPVRPIVKWSDLLREALEGDFASYRARDRDRDRATALDGALGLDVDRAMDRALDRARALAHDHALDRARDLDIALDLALERAAAFDRAGEVANALAHARDRVLALDRDPALDRALDRARALAHDRDLALDVARDLARARLLAQDLDLARDRTVARTLDLARDLALDLALDICVSLAILEQRMRGRLPALESIRVAKQHRSASGDRR